MARDRLLIGGVVDARHFRVFQIWPMIDERAHFDSIHQLRHSADMIAVIVSDQNIIELLDAGLVGGRQDAIGVAAFVSRPAGIDQQRLPRWADNQRRLPALDVDEINLQGFRARGSSGAWTRNQNTKAQTENGNQHGTHRLAPAREMCRELCHGVRGMRHLVFLSLRSSACFHQLVFLSLFLNQARHNFPTRSS